MIAAARLLSLCLAFAWSALLAEPARGQCLGPRGAPLARTGMLVRADWLWGHLDDPDLVILHVDVERDAYEAGHIPGARFLSGKALPSLRAGRVEGADAETLAASLRRLGISNHSRIVLYGPPLEVAGVFVTIDVLGHGNRVSVLEGGLRGWRAAGLSTSAKEPAIEPGDLEPRLESWRLVDEGWVRRAVERREVAIVDARSRQEFESGHIPSARQLDWRLTLEDGLDAGSEETPRLRSIPGLRRLFRLAGIDEAEDVVFYSDSGARAAHLYFVARYLGHVARLHAGPPAGWWLDGS